MSNTSPDDADDAAALAGYARALVDGLAMHLGPWMERMATERYREWNGPLPDAVREDLTTVVRRKETEVVSALRDLLAADVDDQVQNPLALLRAAAGAPTEVLRRAGVPPVERDAMAVRLQPDDLYDLGPATFADIHPDLHEPGLTWGAAKAHVVLARRRREGRR